MKSMADDNLETLT